MLDSGNFRQFPELEIGKFLKEIGKFVKEIGNAVTAIEVSYY